MSNETTIGNTDTSTEKKTSHNENFFVYEIIHEPIAYCSNPSRKGWSLQSQAKTAMELSLINQHGQRRKFTGPLDVVIDFYMMALQRSQHSSKAFEGSWHSNMPDILQLIKFVTQSGCGILFDDDCIISSITAKKHFSKNPKTVFTIRELK